LSDGHDLDNAPEDSGGNHDSVLVEQIVLKSGSEDVATLNEISLGKAMGRVPGPKLILVE